MAYRALFPGAQPYEGMETDQEPNRANHRATHFYDWSTFPLPTDCYAVILCSQLLEHPLQPERLLSDCHRLRQPGGVLLFTTPFLWPGYEHPRD
jgi:2-polyprenyl-3-methyl-5-hydroxy-6-metoxy-1,4-benzoquinol methylase